MHILLVGNGAMAASIKAACLAQGISLSTFGNGEPLPHHRKKGVIALHFGSSRHLEELIDFCERRNIPLIQGSTKGRIPEGRKVVIINAPNLSLPMIRFMHAFPLFAHAISPGMRLSIVESHQQSKPDVSGTARAIVKTLDTGELPITSVRNKDIQLVMGVPAEHLDAHAYHDFVFRGPGVEIKVSTQIRGRDTYTEGALIVARALANLKKPLQHGIYNLSELLHLLPI